MFMGDRAATVSTVGLCPTKSGPSKTAVPGFVKLFIGTWKVPLNTGASREFNDP